jgi:hypothetical protein
MADLMSGLIVGAVCGVIVGATVSAAMRQQDPYRFPRPVNEAEVERLAEALYDSDTLAWNYRTEDRGPFAGAGDSRAAYLRHAATAWGFLTASDFPERSEP